MAKVSLPTDLCPICGRELGTERIEEHHLIPKTFKGKDTISIHGICHRTIHATFTERELLKYYHTIERIVTDEKIERFIEWVKNKPSNFYVSTKDTQTRKGKR